MSQGAAAPEPGSECAPEPSVSTTASSRLRAAVGGGPPGTRAQHQPRPLRAPEGGDGRTLPTRGGVRGDSAATAPPPPRTARLAGFVLVLSLSPSAHSAAPIMLWVLHS